MQVPTSLFLIYPVSSCRYFYAHKARGGKEGLRVREKGLFSGLHALKAYPQYTLPHYLLH